MGIVKESKLRDILYWDLVALKQKIKNKLKLQYTATTKNTKDRGKANKIKKDEPNFKMKFHEI